MSLHESSVSDRTDTAVVSFGSRSVVDGITIVPALEEWNHAFHQPSDLRVGGPTFALTFQPPSNSTGFPKQRKFFSLTHTPRNLVVFVHFEMDAADRLIEALFLPVTVLEGSTLDRNLLQFPFPPQGDEIVDGGSETNLLLPGRLSDDDVTREGLSEGERHRLGHSDPLLFRYCRPQLSEEVNKPRRHMGSPEFLVPSAQVLV